MVAEFEEDFIHLEGGEDRLDEYCCPDRTTGDVQGVLSVAEHVVPEACFEVALQFGEVEVGTGAPVEGLPGRMKGHQAEVDEARRS